MERDGLKCTSPAFVGAKKVALGCDGIYRESGIEREWRIGFSEHESRVTGVEIQLRISRS